MADPSPNNLLKTAVDNGRVDVLRSLLEELRHKKDFHEIVDAVCVQGGTLLHYVTEKSDADSLRTLLTLGANPCVQNDNGKTPLQLAKKDEIRNVYVHELLQAVALSKLGRVCQLLSAGVPNDSIDSPISRNTVLHWAACYGNDGVIKVLCEGGCNLNAKNTKGDTPLHDAVRRGDAVIVKQLLRYGGDPSLKNSSKEDCFDLAAKKPELLQCLSIHNVAQRVQRSNSVQSNESERSLISNASIFDATSSALPSPKSPQGATADGFSANNGNGRMFTFQNATVDKWYELLWPKPHYMSIASTSSSSLGQLLQHEKVFSLPDRKLRVFLLVGNEFGGAEFVRMWQNFVPYLTNMQIQLELEYEVQKCNAERGSGLSCGVFASKFHIDNAYQLRVTEEGVEILAKDGVGLAYGITTFLQCLRIAYGKNEADLSLPKMSIKDWPDTKYRSVFVDFTGCRVYTIDTLCQIGDNLSWLKANQLIVHFEVRIQDPFALPYNQKEIYHLRQYCESRNVELVPSLDINCEEVEPKLANETIGKFLERFAGSPTVHFGPNFSRWILRNPETLTFFVPGRVRHVYITLRDLNELQYACRLPPQCTLSVLCANLASPEDRISELCNNSNSVCLRFANCDVGYLCQAPEEMMKNSILAAQLGEKCRVLSVMACDYVSGCEIVPRSFSFLPELAVLGAAWNRQTDMKRYFFLLPHLAAEHICCDRKMTPLFQELLVMGHLEHEITKMMTSSHFKNNRKSSQSGQQFSTVRKTLSVFVQLLLNPDFIDLELLTPVAFKKVRLELQRCLQSLNNLKRELPYNYELALTVAEVQLIAELMVLTSKIGQSLCLIGTNPRQDVGMHVVNVGVANLLLTSRTDLANKLLEIRTQFQHAWLSRNLPGTLPNAMKIFDNLFKTLLPPALLQYGEKLL